MAQIPRIDPSVQHVPLGQFRRLGADDLPAKTYVINDGGETPLAVCLPYETFLEMQRAIYVPPSQKGRALNLIRQSWREAYEGIRLHPRG